MQPLIKKVFDLIDGIPHEKRCNLSPTNNPYVFQCEQNFVCLFCSTPIMDNHARVIVCSQGDVIYNKDRPLGAVCTQEIRYRHKDGTLSNVPKGELLERQELWKPGVKMHEYDHATRCTEILPEAGATS